jgi:hypothetical protein
LAQGLASASAPIPGGILRLQFVGAGRQLREQAIPLLFRINVKDAQRRSKLPSPSGGGVGGEGTGVAQLAVGQPLKVIAKTTRKTPGVALPQTALVKNSAGESMVWVHAGAERFAPRKVGLQPLDAASAVVTSGLRSGERVVTNGAGLLSQVR